MGLPAQHLGEAAPKGARSLLRKPRPSVPLSVCCAGLRRALNALFRVRDALLPPNGPFCVPGAHDPGSALRPRAAESFARTETTQAKEVREQTEDRIDVRFAL